MASLTTEPVGSPVRTVTVILKTAADWHAWIHTVEQRAGPTIWQYIDPSRAEAKTLPVEPEMPDDTTFPDDDSGSRRWTRAKDKYSMELRSYDRTMDKLQDINSFVHSTITVNNLTYIIQNKKTVHEMLKALRLKFAPTDKAREFEILSRYKQLFIWKRNQDIDMWLDTWLHDVEELKALNCPDVQNERPLWDFLNAIKPINNVFAENKVTALLEQQAKGETISLTLEELIKTFRDFRRYTRATETTRISTHTAFATFQGQRDEQHCICGSRHSPERCWYLNESLRPSWWTPNDRTLSTIQGRIDSNAKIAERIKKIKENDKKRRPTSNQDAKAQNSTRKNTYSSKSTQNAVENTAMTFVSAYSASSRESPLTNHWILDTGSDIHVSNNRERLTNLRKPSRPSQILAGGAYYDIDAFGTAAFDVETPQGTRTMTLLDVALVPQFMANLVSMARLVNKGVDWSVMTGKLTRENKTIAFVNRLNGHWTLSPIDTIEASTTSSLLETPENPPNKHHVENDTLGVAGEPSAGYTPPAVQAIDQNQTPVIPEAFTAQRSNADLELTRKWHSRLGHPSNEVLTHFQTAVEGVPRFVVDTGVCEVCRLSKAKQQISRSAEKEDHQNMPFFRVSCDLIQFEEGYNGDEYITHFEDYATGYSMVFSSPQRSGFAGILREFLTLIRTRYGHLGYVVRVLRMDNETAAVDSDAFEELRVEQGLTVEYSAPRTPAQNGYAERYGRSLIEKARSLRLDANLPASLWPEMARTASHLLNRTPTRRLGWKTPWEALTGQKPSVQHLRLIGCKAFVLQHDIAKKDKLAPRSLIGYVVGYDSRRIWRIWHPAGKTIIRSRDVTFDESQHFNPTLNDDLLALSEVQQLQEVLDYGTFKPQKNIGTREDESDDEEDPDTIIIRPRNSQPRISQQGSQNQRHRSKVNPKTTQQLHTPDATPEPNTTQLESDYDPHDDSSSSTPKPMPSTTSGGVEELPSRPTQASRSRQQEQNEPGILPEGTKRVRKAPNRYEGYTTLSQDDSLMQYHIAFAAAIDSTSNASGRPPTTAEKVHRDSLPPEPRSFKELKSHPLGKEFLNASHKEIRQLKHKGTFRVIDRVRSQIRPLPLLWVYKYKFDNDGYLTKFKARLCVRGDLQINDNDNYAATVAAKTFRALMAITAAFDLEILQLDAVNAFLNSEIDEEVTTECPPGFGDKNTIWQLQKALYGLKQAPLLWYKHLTASLVTLDLKPVPGVNCLFICDWLTLFFYVDDIILLYRRENTAKIEALVSKLEMIYDLTKISQANWFLGIRILRDRVNRRLYLCQDSYIDKLASKFHINTHSFSKASIHTPLSIEALTPYDGEATPRQIHGYQQRIGSINFAAIMTRPDIAKASSVLAQFLRNPSPKHVAAAERVIAYLLSTKHLAIMFSGEMKDDTLDFEAYPFEIFADAAFADNIDRKSSDGYLFMLYGGPIDWKSAKQATVTTSSTEAELLALSATAKDLKWWQRLYRHIQFDIDGMLRICSDNQQTIRLLTSPNPHLVTKLRHVDIHQHWLRQEVQNGEIDVNWVSTDNMKADGFTKALPPQSFARFIRQLNLVNIQASVDVE